MVRAVPVEFDMVYKIHFESIIRGYHVYSSIWTPELGETLECHEYLRRKAKEYDDHAIGLF